MLTTASNKITGMKADGMIYDEYGTWNRPVQRIEDFEMRRLGRKDYAFFYGSQGNWGGNVMEARYKCSYPEAKRRFALKLITERLLK